MKKILTLVLCAALLLSCMPLSVAEEPVKLTLLLSTNGNYNHSDPDRDTSVEEAIEKAVGVELDITWISSTGAAEKVSTMVANNDLPDMFTPGVSVATLVSQGAIMPLDSYFDRIPNYLRHLSVNDLAGQRSAEDGMLYNINMLTDYKPSFTLCYRQDWLDNLGIEKVPETIDEWIEAWKAVRDGDPNKNGDTTDEVPFTDPGNVAGKGGALLMMYGMKTDGKWYYTDDGVYTRVQEHEKYRDYLETMRYLYSEKLVDQEVFTHSATDVATLFNSNTCFSSYQYTSRPENTTKTLAETVPEVHLAPTIPVKGPDGYQLIPQRNLMGYSFVFSYALENDAKKLDAMLRFIDFMYSDEGIFLANYGLEGKHHTLVDGKPVLNADIAGDPSFKTARYAGLICQMFPILWNPDNYNQILTGNKAFEDAPFATQQMILGTQINWPYYYAYPPTVNTAANDEYGADINPKIDELVANCITGKITVDEFFAGYEALKAHGLQEILDQAQAKYTELTK